MTCFLSILCPWLSFIRVILDPRFSRRFDEFRFICPFFHFYVRLWHGFLRIGSRVFLLFFTKLQSENFVIVFLWIWPKAKIIFIAIFLRKYQIWEGFGYWDMGQNALSQLDSRVFKSDIKHEKIDKLTWFLVFRYIFKQHRR